MWRWLCFVFAVPTLGFVAATASELRLDAILHRSLHNTLPGASAAELTRVSAIGTCLEVSSSDPSFCSAVFAVVAVEYAALFAIGVSLVLTAAIYVAGRIARGRRSLLAALFRPGFYCTALSLMILIILHSGIVTTTFWNLGSVFSGRIFIFPILATVIGGFAAVVANVRSVLSVLIGKTVTVPGIPVTELQSPRLWRLVREIAAKLDTDPPRNIVLGTKPGFFVVETPALTLIGPSSGRTLYCSTSLCRILTINELKVIIGHELAHFAGDDHKFSRNFAPLYHGVGEAVERMAASSDTGFFLRLARLPAQAIYSYLLFSFASAEREIARSRELEADRRGATISKPRDLATALVKVHAFSELWLDVEEAVAASATGDAPLPNESATFAEYARELANPEVLEGLADVHTTHPFDSHPTLGERLTSLAVTLSEASKAALEVDIEHAAIELLQDHESFETAITEAHRYILALITRRAMPANDAAQSAA
jgi:Zn-dependent protease with chaperone function